jgi:hypothetical protein
MRTDVKLITYNFIEREINLAYCTKNIASLLLALFYVIAGTKPYS